MWWNQCEVNVDAWIYKFVMWYELVLIWKCGSCSCQDSGNIGVHRAFTRESITVWGYISEHTCQCGKPAGPQGHRNYQVCFEIREDELELLIGKVTEMPLCTPTTILSFGEHHHKLLLHISTLIQLHQIMTLTRYLPSLGLQFESLVAVFYNCKT